jgi:hypothetical protein
MLCSEARALVLKWAGTEICQSCALAVGFSEERGERYGFTTALRVAVSGIDWHVS